MILVKELQWLQNEINSTFNTALKDTDIWEKDAVKSLLATIEYKVKSFKECLH